MISGLSASVSGLWVFVRKLENAARNIANSDTDGYKSKKATIVEDEAGLPTLDVDNTPGALFQEADGVMRENSNVELSEEITDLFIAKRGYEANLKSIKTQDEILESLFDITV